MSNSEWNLSDEFRKLTGAQTEAEALYLLKLIPYMTTSYQLRTDSDWERGGGETYIYRFWIHKEGQENGYIIKACVTLDIERGIDGTIKEWLRRRNLLMQEGISVPLLVYTGNGLIIEELIPWTILDKMRSSSQVASQFIPLLVDYAAALSKLGFAPVEAFSDLRTRGTDVVVVDFGQDLGPPNMTQGPNRFLINALEETLLKLKLLSRKETGFLEPLYLKALNDNPAISA